MVPAITEVVLVPELVSLHSEELVEPDVVLQQAVLALVEVEVRDEVRRPVVSAGSKAVQVAVGPAHRHLDHVVNPGQREVPGHLEAPPDRRLRAEQIETHAESGSLGRRWAQRGLRGGVELLEDAGDPPAEQGFEECLVLVVCPTGDQLLDETLDISWLVHGAQSVIPRRDKIDGRVGRASSDRLGESNAGAPGSGGTPPGRRGRPAPSRRRCADPDLVRSQ